MRVGGYGCPMSAALHVLRPHLPAALTASGVGIWELDILRQCCFFDGVMASFFGLRASQVTDGVPLETIRSKLNPADAERGHRIVGSARSSGGLFVYECRISPSPGTERLILARGRYEKNGCGQPVFARGIAVDITDRKGKGVVGGYAHLAESADPVSPLLDGATASVIAAHEAITALGKAGRPSLLPIIELLLHELGKQHAAGPA